MFRLDVYVFHLGFKDLVEVRCTSAVCLSICSCQILTRNRILPFSRYGFFVALIDSLEALIDPVV